MTDNLNPINIAPTFSKWGYKYIIQLSPIYLSHAPYLLLPFLFPEIISNKIIIEPQHEISNNVVCATSKGSDQPAHTRSLIRAFASRLNILWVLS